MDASSLTHCLSEYRRSGMGRSKDVAIGCFAEIPEDLAFILWGG
jgi:hypothetical protein